MTRPYSQLFMTLILPLINEIEILMLYLIGPTSGKCSSILTITNWPYKLSFPREKMQLSIRLCFQWLLSAAKRMHKHLGIILDSKLNFQRNLREAIIKARTGTGVIRYLSKHVSWDSLDKINALYCVLIEIRNEFFDLIG